MKTNNLNQMRSKIEAELAGLEAAVLFTMSELRKSSEVNSNVFQDSLDCAKAEADLKTTSKIHNNNVAQQLLLKDALIRMNNGTFGICHMCRDEIGIARLTAMPEAMLCIDCQECWEVGETPSAYWADHLTQ